MSQQNSRDDEVTVGELKLQFTANGPDAEKELDDLLEGLEKNVHQLEDASAVIESFMIRDFDANLSWGDES